MDKAKAKASKQESEWDKKKIVVVAIIVFILLFIGFNILNYSLGTSYNKPQKLTQNASGVTGPQFNVGQGVQDQLKAIKNEADNINLVDIATSSPQVQKVIHDLQALKDYPNNQLKQTCINICGKL